MQQQRYVYPVDLTEDYDKLETICTKLRVTKAEALRDALDYYYNYVQGLKIIETRNISKKQAEKEILEYIKKNGRAWTSEIADHLRLDIVQVNDILHELAEKGKLK